MYEFAGKYEIIQIIISRLSHVLLEFHINVAKKHASSVIKNQVPLKTCFASKVQAKVLMTEGSDNCLGVARISLSFVTFPITPDNSMMLITNQV